MITLFVFSFYSYLYIIVAYILCILHCYYLLFIAYIFCVLYYSISYYFFSIHYLYSLFSLLITLYVFSISYLLVIFCQLHSCILYYILLKSKVLFYLGVSLLYKCGIINIYNILCYLLVFLSANVLACTYTILNNFTNITSERFNSDSVGANLLTYNNYTLLVSTVISTESIYFTKYRGNYRQVVFHFLNMKY